MNNTIKVSNIFTSRVLIMILLVCIYPAHVYAQSIKGPPPFARTSEEIATYKMNRLLNALKSSQHLQKKLHEERVLLRKQIARSSEDDIKANLDALLFKMEEDIEEASNDFKHIVAGPDASFLWNELPKPELSLQQELTRLLKPAVDELKQLTKGIRKKTELRERITFLDERLPVMEKALESTNKLIENAKDAMLLKELNLLSGKWSNKLEYAHARKQAAELQLTQLSSEEPIKTRSNNTLKSFFQTRGFYVFIALLSMLVMVLLSRVVTKLIYIVTPNFNRAKRGFKTRLLDLCFRLITVFAVVLSPIFVFFYFEDWLLLSLTILLFFGTIWSLTKTLSRYWRQAQLFLNVGSVREGERIELNGIPWRVKKINIFTELENPVADLKQRISIAVLVDMRSREVKKNDPWFPCHVDEWVLLSDGYFGQAVGISQEMVCLVDKGGSRSQYPMPVFLDLSPRNLSSNFRHSEVIRISYDLQDQATTLIPLKMQSHLSRCIEKEGFSKVLIKLQVELCLAGTSSLDLMILADFSGQAAKDYMTLQRSIQRWAVEACSEHGWEIPFTQLVLHQR